MRRPIRRPLKPHGLTLIEIMVVIVIIGVLATLVGVNVVGRLEEARIQTAVNQIRNFQSSLDHYKIQFGRYPNSSEGLQALARPPRGSPIMTEIPKDPWGNDYIYVSPGTHGNTGYDIHSYGPDGVEGTDDIQSWDLGNAGGRAGGS